MIVGSNFPNIKSEKIYEIILQQLFNLKLCMPIAITAKHVDQKKNHIDFLILKPI